MTESQSSIDAALEAVRRGYQPIPIHARQKNPGVPEWTKLRWSRAKLDDVEQQFAAWSEKGYTNLGLMLGEPSGNLIDVDLDHPKTMRLRDHFLPPTPMITGRAGRRYSHFWYIAEEGTLPDTRRYKMPDGSVSVELRSNRSQTLIPPSVHPEGEEYLWEDQPWGGDRGPAVVNGRVLAVQIALMALATVLVEHWPKQGGRHDAYLALTGGLLWYGDTGIHPWWGERGNAKVLIGALASATHDEEGAEVRIREAFNTTAEKLRAGGKAVGFPRLAELIDKDVVRLVRKLVDEVESAAGFENEHREKESAADSDFSQMEFEVDDGDPMDQRKTTWNRVELEQYLTGKRDRATPSVLRRDDGQPLMYGGRVNMLFGNSESAKSWVALKTCLQEMGDGERVMYLDFEDEPAETVGRLLDLGAGIDELRSQFIYFHPEEPLAPMHRNRWGSPISSDKSTEALKEFTDEITRADPSLIVADGMTVLFSLHGLDTNDSAATDVITSWLKALTRHGRTTVIIIDHSQKNAPKGSLPIGSQHKVSMVMGSLLQVWVIKQPMPGVIGELEIVAMKDRPGQVRKVAQQTSGSSKAQVCARIEMDSTEEGRVDMKILPPDSLAVSDPDAPDVVIDLSQSGAAKRHLQWAEQRQRIIDCYAGVLDEGKTIVELVRETGLSRAVVEARLQDLTNPSLGLYLSVTKAPAKGRGRPAYLYSLTMREDEPEESEEGEA